MSNRLFGGVRIGFALLAGVPLLVPSATTATTVQATLAASVKVVASCQVSKTASITFPDVTSAGPEDVATANGSMTYQCQGAGPQVSASDNSGNAKFLLSRASGNPIGFTLCVVDRGNTKYCSALTNGNKTSVALPESGTEVLRGTIDRPASATYQIGDYADNVTLTLTF